MIIFLKKYLKIKLKMNIIKKYDYYNISNDKFEINKYYNTSSKANGKYILINNENIIPKKIKEIEIKNNKNNECILRRPKSEILFKINRNQQLKTLTNNKPYLKPKFLIINKNSFYIRNNNIRNNDNINEEINNIYLNFFKIYYDENGKRVKIIKNKSNYKNKLKELVLTQKNN